MWDWNYYGHLGKICSGTDDKSQSIEAWPVLAQMISTRNRKSQVHLSWFNLQLYTNGPAFIRLRERVITGEREGIKLYLLSTYYEHLLGLPWWLTGKEFACQCWRHGFDPWVGKIPWRRKWQLLQYSCLGNPRRACQRSLVGYSAWGHRVRMHFTHLFPQRLIVHVLLVQKNISLFLG